MEFHVFGKDEGADALVACHRLRHRVFVEELTWREPSVDGLEKDAYDESDGILHVVGMLGNRPLTYCRLLPLSGPCLIDEFGFRNSTSKQDDSVEASRFSLDKGIMSDAGIAPRDAIKQTLAAMIKASMSRSSGLIYAVTDTRFERVLTRCGIVSRRVGSPKKMADCTAVAGFFEASSEQLNRLGVA